MPSSVPTANTKRLLPVGARRTRPIPVRGDRRKNNTSYGAEAIQTLTDPALLGDTVGSGDSRGLTDIRCSCTVATVLAACQRIPIEKKEYERQVQKDDAERHRDANVCRDQQG